MKKVLSLMMLTRQRKVSVCIFRIGEGYEGIGWHHYGRLDGF